MGNALIDGEFDDLRVDQDQLDFLRCGMVQDTHDNGVGADRLTGTGGSGDDHMGQPCNVADDGVAGNIPPHGKRQLALVAVGDFDADRRLPRNGGFDADTLCRQRQGNVVCQSGDLGNLDAGGRLYLIPRDGRTAENTGNADSHAKAFQRVHQNARFFFHLLIYRRVAGTADTVLQKVDAGDLVGTCRNRRCCRSSRF